MNRALSSFYLVQLKLFERPSLMCWWYERQDTSEIPQMLVVCHKRCSCGGVTFLEAIVIVKHLLGLNCMNQVSCHSSSRFRSFCRMDLSWADFTGVWGSLLSYTTCGGLDYSQITSLHFRPCAELASGEMIWPSCWLQPSLIKLLLLKQKILHAS